MAEQNHFKLGVWYGMGAALLLNVIAIIYGAVSSYGPVLVALIGIVQLVYITPLSLLSLFIPKYGTGILSGMWIMAGITFLLNMIGCGMMASGLIRGF